MCNNLSWSELYRHRRAAAARFGSIFALPLARRASDLALANVDDGARVLEVGAGDRRLARKLADRRRGVQYQSLDVDPAGAHDFRSFAEVDGRYHALVALELVEHLALDELVTWLGEARERLLPGGRLVLSTPNTYYPPAWLRDATHRTPLCYDELAGLVAAAGFELLAIWRVYHDPLVQTLLRRYLFGWLFRLIGIDFARQIVVVARRPA